MALPHHFILRFSRFGVALRPTNTLHPHSKSDNIWVHKRTASTGQDSGKSLFCRRNPYLTHVHIYTSAQAHARTLYPKLDCTWHLLDAKQQQDPLRIMGFTY